MNFCRMDLLKKNLNGTMELIIVMKVIKNMAFYDAQQRNTFYTIFNDSVYHTSYAGPQELRCKFCGMDEELLV